jgi:hypothetical protein
MTAAHQITSAERLTPERADDRARASLALQLSKPERNDYTQGNCNVA